MKSLTAKQLMKILKDNNFILSRQKGSHMIWKNKETGIIVPVPLHGKSKPIFIGTLKAIIKQSKIDPKKFI
jgi:predicted RNA binding protein YcfA (HicA-like mRNA interferase family)